MLRSLVVLVVLSAFVPLSAVAQASVYSRSLHPVELEGGDVPRTQPSGMTAMDPEPSQLAESIPASDAEGWDPNVAVIDESLEEGGSAGAGQFSCWHCNWFNGDCCGGFCVCEPECPGTYCTPLCGGDACGPGCADECSPILCAGNYCNPQRCPNTMGWCDLLCGGSPCAPGCPDECNPVLCPANALCHTQCGGHPCNVGCVCEPDCPTTRCSPFCGGDACAAGCADECSPVLCRWNYCNSSRCPTLPQCDLLCGGDPCRPGCPDECSWVVCPTNALCKPQCNGPSMCDVVLCPSTACNDDLCPGVAGFFCDLCGRDPCGEGCSTECFFDWCLANFLCKPQCGGHPCNFGCVCEPDCPTTRCSPFCGGDACAAGCADECSPILCAGNYCNPERCPNTMGWCDVLCGGDICGPGCPDECSPILCPANALCHTQCGGDPCNFGCICEPDCPTTRCSPFCPGGDACAPGCADECSPVLCLGNYCDPQRCPSEWPRSSCDLLCGGNPCNFGCPDECSQVLCPLNSCKEQCRPECNLLCGGSPCNPGCPDECSFVLCPQNHCSPQCNSAPQCDLLCGGDPCGPYCPDECSPILCPTNLLCEPRCGADPCSFGCICEPECWQTQWNPLCGGSPECSVGLPIAAGAGAVPLKPDDVTGDGDIRETEVVAGKEAVKVTPPTYATEKRVDSRLWGFADLHNHQFANLAFGGKLVAGKPFEPSLPPEEGIGYALHCCGDNPEVPCGTIECLSNPLNNHGMCGCGDIVGMAMGHPGEFLCHHVGGYPEFEGWPRWYSYTHQQVYFEWLKRAWEGGLRLMTMHAVNSEVLCQHVDGIYPCDDMEAVDRQILAAKQLEQYVDSWDDGNGENNSGWYRIAYSAQEARQIVNEGKLAVVLGIEVAGLFGCQEKKADRCTPEYIEEQLQYYYEMGVRQITPIHVINNAFGGAAVYNEFFNLANKIINDQYFDIYDCSSDGYEFRFNGDPLLAIIGGYFPPEYPKAPAAHCNVKRLTDVGHELIMRMMAKGMIIDVDHMSARTKSDVLQIAESQCYPLISSHCGFSEISRGPKNHESQENKDQIARIRALGGLLAPITHQGDACETDGEHEEGCIRRYAHGVENNCDNSSRTWAQAYLYAVDQAQGGAVAMGTDFNGGAGQPSPRYGPDACNRRGGGDQEKEVQYPFALHGLPGTMGPSVTGQRTFNVNCDGLAHVGMLPDFVEDLKQIGVDNAYLEPLFHSAEAYITLWERAEAQSDGRTDLRDLRALVECLAGPGKPASSCVCRRFDQENDGDIDLRDAAGLLRDFTGR